MNYQYNIQCAPFLPRFRFTSESKKFRITFLWILAIFFLFLHCIPLTAQEHQSKVKQQKAAKTESISSNERLKFSRIHRACQAARRVWNRKVEEVEPGKSSLFDQKSARIIGRACLKPKQMSSIQNVLENKIGTDTPLNVINFNASGIVPLLETFAGTGTVTVFKYEHAGFSNFADKYFEKLRVLQDRFKRNRIDDPSQLLLNPDSITLFKEGDSELNTEFRKRLSSARSGLQVFVYRPSTNLRKDPVLYSDLIFQTRYPDAYLEYYVTP